MNQRSCPFRGLALVLALVLSEPGWTATPTVEPQLPDPGSVGISKQQQVQLGRQAMAEVYKQMPVLPDSSPETRYIRQLGRTLAAVIPEPASALAFQVDLIADHLDIPLFTITWIARFAFFLGPASELFSILLGMRG